MLCVMFTLNIELGLLQIVTVNHLNSIPALKVVQCSFRVLYQETEDVLSTWALL
jgi:hypothetical protein